MVCENCTVYDQTDAKVFKTRAEQEEQNVQYKTTNV